MKRFSEMAYRECLARCHAACRLPVDTAAALVAGWLRPSFERILGAFLETGTPTSEVA